MKKKIQKPFDIEAAKNGAKVETRDGMPVRIICYDKVDGIYPIIGLVNNDGYEACNGYTPDGKLFCSGPGEHDLVIVEEVEETKFKEGDWVFLMNGKVYPYLITAITSDCYELQDTQGNKIEMFQTTVEANYHLWSIKDAKPGDVLIYEYEYGKNPFIFKETFGGYPTAYCGIDVLNSIVIGTNGLPWTYSPVRPATYKERQQFFNRLEEESYKWETESFTLTKIQKNGEIMKKNTISGYYIYLDSCITYSEGHSNTEENYNIFATEKQAKSAIAMARISQIMANDERFGGVVTDEEWCAIHSKKFVIKKLTGRIVLDTVSLAYNFLAFHTKKQAELFLKENEDLVKDYYMLD